MDRRGGIGVISHTGNAHSQAHCICAVAGRGVARYVADPDNDEAEIAISIADQYAGKGLDRLLLDHLIKYARDFGVTRLYSVELAANAGIRKLMRASGFRAARDPEDATQVIYSLELSG